MEGIREIRTIWAAETWRTLKSARAVVTLLLYVLFTVLVVLALSSFSLQLSGGQMEAAGGEELAQKARESVIRWMFRDDSSLVESLAQIPLTVLIAFKATLIFLPFYVAILGFDQLSGEVGPRSIRYLTIRARRSSILLGKFVSQATVLLALAFIVELGIFVHAGLTNEALGWTAASASLFRIFGVTWIFALVYLALTSLCSTLFRTPVVSLVMNLLLLMGLWLMAFIGRLFVSVVPGIGGAPSLEEASNPVAYVRFLSPWTYSGDLLHPALRIFGLSALAHVAFAAVFLGAAYLILRRRDL